MSSDNKKSNMLDDEKDADELAYTRNASCGVQWLRALAIFGSNLSSVLHKLGCMMWCLLQKETYSIRAK